MATNLTFMRNDSGLGTLRAVAPVDDLPCRKQIISNAITFTAAKPGVSGSDIAVLPVKAGQIVNKVFLIVKTAGTPSGTATIGWVYSDGSAGSADAFDKTASALDAAQSATVPGIPAGTLEATDTDASNGIYFPVDGYISLRIGGANMVAGTVVVAAEVYDLAKPMAV